MMTRLVVLAASSLAHPVASSFDAHLATGLALNVEAFQEALVVDGVPMQVRRATGSAVPELARRIEAQWRSQGSDVKTPQRAGWSVRSRIRGSRSEVMQWRTDIEVPELLWSTLDAAHHVIGTPEPGLALPAGCAWGRHVAGTAGKRRFSERSARCNLTAAELSPLLRRSLESAGWQIRSYSQESMFLDRPGTEGMLSLSGQEADSSTWVVWLQVEGAP